MRKTNVVVSRQGVLGAYCFARIETGRGSNRVLRDGHAGTIWDVRSTD